VVATERAAHAERFAALEARIAALEQRLDLHRALAECEARDKALALARLERRLDQLLEQPFVPAPTPGLQ
jgi:hypothetical protein